MFCEKAISEKNNLPSQLQSIQCRENAKIVVATEEDFMNISFERTNVVFFAMQSVSNQNFIKHFLYTCIKPYKIGTHSNEVEEGY